MKYFQHYNSCLPCYINIIQSFYYNEVHQGKSTYNFSIQTLCKCFVYYKWKIYIALSYQIHVVEHRILRFVGANPAGRMCFVIPINSQTKKQDVKSILLLLTHKQDIIVVNILSLTNNNPIRFVLGVTVTWHGVVEVLLWWYTNLFETSCSVWKSKYSH